MKTTHMYLLFQILSTLQMSVCQSMSYTRVVCRPRRNTNKNVDSYMIFFSIKID